MQKVFSRIVLPLLGAALIIGTLFMAGGAGWLAAPNAQAQAVPTASISVAAPGTITVVGEGKVSLKPDIARVTIGVETVNVSVQEATAANKTIVEAVLAALQAEGVAESDLRTTGFSVFAERYGPEGMLPDNEVRYRVSNSVSVTIRDLDKVGAIIDVAVDAGANNIYGVEFALDDTSVAQSDARSAAIANGLQKATELAELSGVSLGRVVSISEVIGAGGGYYAGTFSEMARMGFGGGGGAPIAPGQLDLVMQLQIVYAIAE